MRCFSKELTNVPECITKDGKPYHSTKSTILDIMLQSCLTSVEYMQLVATGLVVDLSPVIRAKSAVIIPESTFFDLASMVLRDIQHNAERVSAKRIDIVADQYHPLSIKKPTRDERYKSGSGQRVDVRRNDTLPSQFTKVFLSNGQINQT